MSKTGYVNGLAFSKDEKNVVLIRKNRPNWMKNKLNGVGGHIELGESPEEAIRREFREETGLDIEEWTKFLVHESPNHVMHCFKTVIDVNKVNTMTDEAVLVVNVSDKKDFIENLLWMIPMALDKEVRLAQVEIQKI